MIEWNDNAKAAVRAFADYIGQTKKCHRYLESFASKKTVADAVEYCNGVWPEEKDAVCVWDDKRKNFEFWISDYEPVSYCYEVCNYEQFEAYVKEQEGEKWTHTIKATKEKCRITEGPNNSGQVFIKTEVGLWDCLYIEQLKLIKPTISQEQAKAVMEFATEHGLISEGQIWTSKEREIIEGPAND